MMEGHMIDAWAEWLREHDEEEFHRYRERCRLKGRNTPDWAKVKDRSAQYVPGQSLAEKFRLMLEQRKREAAQNVERIQATLRSMYLTAITNVTEEELIEAQRWTDQTRAAFKKLKFISYGPFEREDLPWSDWWASERFVMLVHFVDYDLDDPC
jgi:DNA primase